MCKFKSAIVLLNGDIIHNPFTDSHEDLIELAGLIDNGKGNFVRVEFCPTERYDNLEKYVFKVDQLDVPEWFGEVEESVKERMTEIIRSMIVKEDQKIIIGRSVILSGDVKINKIRHCIIQEMYGNSQVKEMDGNSQVTRMDGNSQVKEMYGNSQVTRMYGNSQKPK